MTATLEERFQTYFDDIEKCRSSGAYWSLLHVIACLPDICAALQSPDGKSTGPRYISWCDKFATDPALTGAERWGIRCKVLHQGRAATNTAGRYTNYAFGKPAATGEIDHKRLDGTTLHLDIGEAALEISRAVAAWIAWLNANPDLQEAENVTRHLPEMVQVTKHTVSQPSPSFGFAVFQVNKTN